MTAAEMVKDGRLLRRGYLAFDPTSRAWVFGWTREYFDVYGWETVPLYSVHEPIARETPHDP